MFINLCEPISAVEKSRYSGMQYRSLVVPLLLASTGSLIGRGFSLLRSLVVLCEATARCLSLADNLLSNHARRVRRGFTGPAKATGRSPGLAQRQLQGKCG